MIVRPPLLLTDDPDAAPLFKRILLWAGLIAGFTAAIAGFRFSLLWLRGHHGGLLMEVLLSLAYCAAILTVAFLYMGRALRYSGVKCSPAMGRYRRRMMMTGVVYCLAVMTAVFAFKIWTPMGPLAFAIVLLPALPIAGMVVVMGLYLKEETDEFWRIQQTESALLAVGGMFILTTAWGFLEMFRLVPHLQLWLVFPLWALLLGPSSFIVRRRYR
jgi:hypothetical protein